MYIFSQDKNDIYDLSKYANIHMEDGCICLSRLKETDGGVVIGNYTTDVNGITIMKCISGAISDGVKLFVLPEEAPHR